MKKLTIISALASAVLLAGCASAPKTHHSTIEYEPILSRANNIGRLFNLRRDRDRLAPENVAPSGSNIDAINSWTGTAAITADIANMAGANALAGVYGAGLVLSLLSGPDIPSPSLSGYLPETEAATAEEARKIFIDRFLNAVKDGILSIDPKAKFTHKEVEIDDFIYNPELFIESEVLGCYAEGDREHGFSWCKIQPYTISCPDGPWIASTILGSEPVRSWVFDWGLLSVHMREGFKVEEKIDWNRVAVASAKFLPPNMYLNMPIRKISGKQYAPPFIVEKDRVNFFVVDKENFDKQTERFGKR